jgi:hypothetical protein
VNLSVIVLEKIGLVTVEDADAAGGDARRMLRRLQTQARRLDPDHLDVPFVPEGIEEPHGVTAAADAGDEHIGQPSLLGENLFPGLPPMTL